SACVSRKLGAVEVTRPLSFSAYVQPSHSATKRAAPFRARPCFLGQKTNARSVVSSGGDGLATRGCGTAVLHRFGSEVREKRVPTLARHADVFRAEGAADALLRERRRMDRIMQEPRAVVVPQMMIRVFRADADTGECG